MSFNKALSLQHYTNLAKIRTSKNLHTLALYAIAEYLREKENYQNEIVGDLLHTLLSLNFLQSPAMYGCANKIAEIREDVATKLLSYLEADELIAFNKVM